MYIKKQKLDLDMEKLTGSKLGKKFNKPMYNHSVDLAYMQSPSGDMLVWMNHKLESKLLGET